MSIETFKAIIGETSFTDAQLEVLLDRAISMALNHYFWGEGDIPTAEELRTGMARFKRSDRTISEKDCKRRC